MRVLKAGANPTNPKPWDWEKDNQFCIIDAGILKYGLNREAASASTAKTLRLADFSCTRNNEIMTLTSPTANMTLKAGTKDIADSFHKSLLRYCKSGEDLKKMEEEKRRAEVGFFFRPSRQFSANHSVWLTRARFFLHVKI